MIADDHTLFREGLRELISHWQDLQVVGMAVNGQEAVAVYWEAKPDLVLMDLDMPVLDGLDATRIILQEYPNARIVLMVTSVRDPKLPKAIQLGAYGYLLKGDISCQLHHLLLGWCSDFTVSLKEGIDER
jgi:DNA-binding NarL/FixJ family response regulator